MTQIKYLSLQLITSGGKNENSYLYVAQIMLLALRKSHYVTLETSSPECKTRNNTTQPDVDVA